MITLKSYTQSVDPTQTTEDLLVYIARVSNPQNQGNTDTGQKLIKYLIKKGHWSPFEMIDLTFEIKTTRDIGRQILRHRSFSFQEFSLRYAEAEDTFIERECRTQDVKNRQNSIVAVDEYLQAFWHGVQKAIYTYARFLYKQSLEKDIAKEQARAILPEGLTPSTMYMKGSMRSWFHYCLVRCHPGTQKEHRDIADEIWRQIQERFECFRSLDIRDLSILYQESFEAILEQCEMRFDNE